MKKLLLALIFLASFTGFAEAQCNGVFPNNTVCGNVTGSSNTPRPTNPSAFLGSAGGTNGQVQYNSGGVLAGESQVTTTQGGTGINNSTNVSGEVLASNGTNGNFIHTGLASLFNAACTISPSLCAKFTGYYSPYWYGALCDGSTVDTTAIQAALTAATGKAILFPAATCVVSTTTLSIPANIVVTGVGRDISVIKTLSCVPLMTVSNVPSVTIEKLWLRGSDACVSWASSPIGAINFGADQAGSNNWTFRNLKLTGFNSSYWMYGNAAVSIFNFTMDNISIETAIADVPGSAIDIEPNQLIALFSGLAGARWENLTISNSQFNAPDACIHLVLFGNAYKYTISGNRSINPGGANTFGHCTNGFPATNAYCYAVYDQNNDGNPQLDGMIINNYCLNPIASGIYMVPGSALTRASQGQRALIANNEISGQTHTDVFLARGAIALNTSTDITITGNKLYGNAIGINVQAQASGVVSVLSNDCYSGAGGSICLNLQAGSNGSSNTDRRVVRGNYFEGGGNSVVLVSSAGGRFNEVDISGNTIVADSASTGAGLQAGSQLTTGVIQIKANSFTGPNSLAMASLGSITGNLSLAGNTFTVPSTGTSGYLFANLPAATNGSDIFVQDGTAASSPCTGGGTGSRAFRQNGAWKCF